MTRHRRSVLLLILLTLLVIPGAAQAQNNRSWEWTRWDVEISNINTSANIFHVVETQVIHVTSGSFGGGDRSVALDNATSVTNVTVTDGSTPLRLVNGNSASNCPTTPGIYCLFTTGNNERDIYYNFATRAYAGDTHTMRLEYDVHGDLRSYTDGDQFWWKPLATTRDFPVLSSRVVVTMPSSRPPQVVATYGPLTYRIDGNIVTFQSTGPIGENDLVETRIQYPHDPAMAAPPWQASFDRQRALEQQFGPIIPLLMLALGLLLGIGGPVFVFIQYSTRGRDPEPVAVPEYLAEPPGDQPPGIVGTLIDESADMEDIMATLLDLARRGYLVIEQEEHQGLFSRTPEFVFHRTEPSAAQGQAAPGAGVAAPDAGLRPYERTLLNGIFQGSTTTRLSDLRNRFYTTIPAIKSGLYNEVVGSGYFTRSPELTRNIWGGLGIFLLIVAGAGVFLFFFNPSKSLPNIPLLPVPCFGLGIFGLAMLLVSTYMPAKTRAGSQEAAKWRAFRTYLANINKYADLKEASQQFDQYIGYAVAFGLSNQFVRAIAPAMTSMPSWYYPTYLGGPWGGGYRHYGPGFGTNMIGQPGGFNAPNFGSGGLSGGLNSMSENMTQGLNAMSSGLTSLLNSAGSVMTSRPSSSSSGGSHGGFSGGGFSGGGGGGGGHAGGH